MELKELIPFPVLHDHNLYGFNLYAGMSWEVFIKFVGCIMEIAICLLPLFFLWLLLCTWCVKFLVKNGKTFHFLNAQTAGFKGLEIYTATESIKLKNSFANNEQMYNKIFFIFM